MSISEVNDAISRVDANQVSDGYHTFGELYDHRIALFIWALSLEREKYLDQSPPSFIWRSKTHSDGTVWDGWFILGMNKEAGKQITYHLPLSEWDNCQFADTLAKAPDWDGHTSADVLARIKAQL